MAPNFLYGSSTIEINYRDHHYETVTAVHTAINTEPNVVYGVKNPLFSKSSLVLKQPAVDEEPGYSYPYTETSDTSVTISGLVIAEEDEQQQQQQQPPLTAEEVAANIKKTGKPDMPLDTTGDQRIPYNRLDRGNCAIQPQVRLTKLEGSGYDALNN